MWKKNVYKNREKSNTSLRPETISLEYFSLYNLKFYEKILKLTLEEKGNIIPNLAI